MNDNDSLEHIPPDTGSPRTGLDPWGGEPGSPEPGAGAPSLASETWDSTDPNLPEAPANPEMLSPSGDFPLFHSFSQPELIAPTRIPHLGHLAFLALPALAALLCVFGLTQLALHYHLFGVSTVEAAQTDIHYTLGTMALLYLLTFAAGLPLFPIFWRRGFFSGLQWNVAFAMLHRQRLLATAGACFVLAIVNGILLPGPNDAPIDKMFRTPEAAWLLFGFGVTFAPFFEEIFFRGFLLPALATSCDWIGERSGGKPARLPDASNHPLWSFPAMAIASVLTSIPFALLHAEQTGWAIGPFLMLVGVSLVLCWVRLSTRSLAACVVVHACYNFMLFTLMLLSTEGFRHMDKL